MKKIHFEIKIDAPAEKIWNTMLEDETYRQWTEPFGGGEGAHYEGNWQEGETMRFLDGSGKNGMFSTVVESRPPEYMSVKHLGIIKDGVEETDSEETKKCAPAYENYTLSEKDGVTTVKAEQDIAEEYEEMFEKMWPEALEKLKELSEG